jgi:hypothetical protein
VMMQEQIMPKSLKDTVPQNFVIGSRLSSTIVSSMNPINLWIQFANLIPLTYVHAPHGKRLYSKGEKYTIGRVKEYNI